MSADAIVTVQDLDKVFRPFRGALRLAVRTEVDREVHALRGIGLQLHGGELAAVVGPNGAGKTTLFRILSGLLARTSGVVQVLGHDPDAQPREVRRRIGWMPADEHSLFMRLSPIDNLAFHGRLQAMATPVLRRRIPEVLERVGLTEKSGDAVFSLSSGMRARLQLARALLHRPRLLLLDEPTASVDPVAAHALLELIRSAVADDGVAALVSSHRLEEIEALAARVVLLDGGSILHDGDLGSVHRRWGRTELVLRFLRPAHAERAEGLSRPLFEELRRDAGILTGILAPRARVGDVLQALGPLAGELQSVSEQPMPLRDLLARVYASTGDRP